jgi:hypothetical protein
MSKKRFLTIFFSALFILLSVVGLFLYEYVRIRPNNVHFTNVTSSSVTVSWNTERAVPASVKVFKGDRVIPFSIYHSNDRFFDTRDVKEAELLAVQQTSDNIVENDDLTVSVDDFQTDVVVTDMGEYYTHHVTITNLDPETEYSFMVGDKYLFREVEDVNGNAVVSTLQIPEEVKSPFPAYGTVKDANNQEDAVDEDLIDVTDGIVYFNYLDEFSGDKSAVYSSSLNNEGRWYIDVSNAVDENGNPFIDRYYNEITNILVELTIDVGPLGIWKKQVFYPNMAPTEKVVLNFPVEVDKDNIQYPLEKIESSNIIKEILGKSIKSVHATERNCQCSGFCSWIWFDYDTNSWKGCSYSDLTDAQKATYEYRNCEEVKSEIPSGPDDGCNGGDYKENAYACIDTDNCGQCKRRDDGTYYWAQHQTSSSCPSPCGSGGGGNDPQSCFRVSNNRCEPFTYTGDQPNCGSNYTTIEECQASLRRGDDNEETAQCYKVNYNSGVGFYSCGTSKVTYSGGSTCPDGENGNDYYTSLDDCRKKANELNGGGGEEGTDSVQWCGPNNVGKPCERPLEIIGVCSTSNKCVIPGSECSDGTFGKWNEEGECIPYTADELCWLKKSRHTLYKGSGANRMVCSDGVWVSDPVTKEIENWCKLGGLCDKVQDICLADGGNYYVCKVEYFGGDTLIWQEYEKSEGNIAVEVEPINAGDECKAKKCRCVDGVDKNKIISENEWCRESRLSIEKNLLDPYNRICVMEEEGVVCSRSGITCTLDDRPGEGGERYYCSGEKPKSSSGNQSNVDLISLQDFTSQVLGQETESQFLIDQSTGMFTQIDQGTYVFEYQGENYAFDVGDVDTDGVLVYIDDNENGRYDEETDINVSEIASIVNISTVEKAYRYNLKAGLNFISLPFLISYEDSRTAAGLLTKLNEVYDDAFYSISKFDGRWKIVGQNVEIYDNNDFQLLPGEGYMIKAKRDIDISIVGQPVQLETEEDKSPIYMTQGWNLIGLYGTGIKSYTAKTLIEDINKDNFTADNVTKWASDKQMYEGFQISDGEEYGFDYPLNILESYFVRIIEGKGNWQPSLSGNN